MVIDLEFVRVYVYMYSAEMYNLCAYCVLYYMCHAVLCSALSVFAWSQFARYSSLVVFVNYTTAHVPHHVLCKHAATQNIENFSTTVESDSGLIRHVLYY
jgi:hypothetical protein